LSKIEEVRQISASESNFSVDICFQDLKLEERANERGEAVVVDVQDDKYLVETYEKEFKWRCYMKNIIFDSLSIQSPSNLLLVMLFSVLISPRSKSIPLPCLPIPVCNFT
jgi:hypothetical protein